MPRRAINHNASARKEKPVRHCERMIGSIPRILRLGNNLPVKAARPRVAEKPQKNVAAPIYKKPRNELRLSGCGFKAFDPTAGDESMLPAIINSCPNGFRR